MAKAIRFYALFPGLKAGVSKVSAILNNIAPKGCPSAIFHSSLQTFDERQF
jgi:hypothetical protein